MTNLPYDGDDTMGLSSKMQLKLTNQLLVAQQDYSNNYVDVKENDSFIPKEQFLYIIAERLEDKFRNFDDTIIRWCQYYHVKKDHKNTYEKAVASAIKWMALVFTYATQIENGPSLAMIFFLLGRDYTTGWLILLGWLAAVLAQFPKRFSFRKRPYMAGRALDVRGDKTSSFPSRSVVCAIVFGYGLLSAYNYHVSTVLGQPDQQIGGGSIFLIVAVFSLLTSISRIHLGVHYPSDCLAGCILGLTITLLSWLMFQIPNIFGCPSCYANGCYPQNTRDQLNDDNFSPQNIGLALWVFAVTFILFLLMIIPPLRFWEKAAPVFGSFLACIVALILTVCPKANPSGLKYVPSSKISGWKVFLAIIIGESNLLLAVYSTKKFRTFKNVSFGWYMIWNAAIFLAFFVVYTIVLIQGRLWLTF